MLAAAFGLVYAGLVVQPYVQRMAGQLDRIQLVVGDEDGREQVRKYVASNYSFLAVLARDIRAAFVIPFLQAFVAMTAFMSSLVAADRMFHVYIALYWRLFSNKQPHERYPVTPLPDPDTIVHDAHSGSKASGGTANASDFSIASASDNTKQQRGCGDFISIPMSRPPAAAAAANLPDDVGAPAPAAGGELRYRYDAPGAAEVLSCFPTVVVQLPMFNEREVCQNIIDAACELRWPRSRLLVQVLDNSTCEVTRERVEDSVLAWRERGVQIVHRWRKDRGGYKAGAMHEAMDDIAAYDFCAVFDADFDPAPDFLLRTVPYLAQHPRVGFVQARWVYTNPGECVLTRVQEISLNYHIRCEQYARFAAGLFFNFNGTAGVWRRECIVDAGGWNNRTTVEDMDLSLRAFLRGWEFVFLDHVTCMNEIPANYDAFRKQQHRWSCGPMQLWRKAMAAVWASDVPLAQKFYLNGFFFGTRMFAAHIVSFFLYCCLIPICATAPEVHIPIWALVYMPVLVTLSTVAFTPRGWAYAVPYVLYENAMCIVKVSAMLAGILELSNAHEWVVTTKLGKWVANKVEKAGNTKVATKIKQGLAGVGAKAVSIVPARKVYRRELCMGVFFLACGTYGVAVHAMWQYSVFLLLQGVVFVAFGANFVN